MSLPAGWDIKTLGEVAELIGGGTPSRKESKYFLGDIVWLTPTQIPKNRIMVVYDSKEKITKEALKKSSAKLIPAGSVLMTSRASIGYIAIAGTEVTTNQGFASFVCNDNVINYFLAYWLSANTDFFIQKATGTTFKEITKSKLRTFTIPIPPLPEQERIVARIEELFTQLDAGVTSLKRVKVALKRYKASVLKAAFEGKLINKQSKDCNEHIRADWNLRSLDEACEIILGQSPPSETYNTEEIGLPFYQGKAEFGEIYPAPVKWCSKPKKIAQENDILISVRAPVGPTNLCQEDSCIGRGLAAIRPKSEMPSKYFLYYLRHIENTWETTGTTFNAITGSVLRKRRIPLPSLAVQHQIVAEIEQRLSVAVQIEETVDAGLKRAVRLKQAILKCAFEGRLVSR